MLYILCNVAIEICTSNKQRQKAGGALCHGGECTGPFLEPAASVKLRAGRQDGKVNKEPFLLYKRSLI